MSVAAILFCSCTQKIGYLEVTNDTPINIFLKAKNDHDDWATPDWVTFSPGQTTSFTLPIKSVPFYGGDGTEVDLLQKGRDEVLFVTAVQTDNTTKVTVSLTLTTCPDPRLIGKWTDQYDGGTITFENNNRCTATGKHLNSGGIPQFQWKAGENKVFLKKWNDVFVEGWEPWRRELDIKYFDAVTISINNSTCIKGAQ